jgi:2'-5' RNA ligase
VRLFLALELPPSVRRALGAVRAELEERASGWRWVSADALHVTMRFLGEVDPELDARARPLWRAAAAGARPFAATLAGLGTFPPGGRPRVLWAGFDDDPPGSAAALAGALRQAARGLGLGLDRKERTFRQHVTLARARRGETVVRPVDAAVSRERFDIGELVLFRSRTDAEGARYTALERFPLVAEV